MILGREDILSHIENGSIVVDPFSIDLVSINSIDIRLGAGMWKPAPTYGPPAYRDLYKSQDKYWEKINPVPAARVRVRYPGWAEGVIEDNHPCHILYPGKFRIGTTLEAIGTKNTPELKELGYSLAPEIKAKSTFGRDGFTVALCAGWGDVGYRSTWALEIRPIDEGGDVPIAVGTMVGQVVFHKVTYTEEEYNGITRYQNGNDVRFLPKPLKVVL